MARPATQVAGFQTLTSGLRRVIWRHDRPSVFAGTSARGPAMLREVLKARHGGGRVTHRSRCPLRAQSDEVDAEREMT